jgi:tetratricopeptide (TPR) repeat protein
VGRKLPVVLFALLVLLPAVRGRADEILLEGGGRLSGEVVEESSGEVTLLLPNGKMRVPRARIKEIVREDRRTYLRREAAEATSKRAAVRLYERALEVSGDDDTRHDLANALYALAEEQLDLYRLDDAEATLGRLRQVAPGAPTDHPAERLEKERASEREERSLAKKAIAEGRFDAALIHIEAWRLRARDDDPEVRTALDAAHLGAGRADEAHGSLRLALDHYRMARSEADVARLAPIAVLEAMHGGDLDAAARMLGPLGTYPDPGVPRFLEAVLAHLRGDVKEAVAAYADAARLAKEGGPGEGYIPYEAVRVYATATLAQAIARPPQEGQKKWRETFLDPLVRDDGSTDFTVYAATAEAAHEASEKGAEIYERIALDLFGTSPDGPRAEVVCHPTREAYVAADPTPEGSPLAAVALGREPTAGVCYDTLDDDGKPLIRVEVDAGEPHWLEDTLPHELVHLAQRRGWKTFRKGHWLDEGLATLYESQDSQDSRLALWRQVEDKSIPLPELLALKSTPPDRALLFYVEAHALCRYLKGLGGDDEWHRFLDAFGDTDFETAIRTVYGIESVADLERSFRAWRG